ncbi:protein VASCULATURE COMPLEXITY AND CONNECTIVITY-like [Solanum dulcamara]|uniref:protein VASCULATURE COMPLEXITY AND CONNECTIVITY-like n=1 Tax=Solanum dulcamara TaxID=45834 RepID=UPI0024851D36|nr:protein VASCULATURE COMPLEXITY AND CONNECTIVITY-like [Solanum dulcamara]
MAKLFGIFACLLIVALDSIAGILGIKAEAAQNQEKHLRLWLFECKEPSHDAFVLGVAAACLLAIAHVLANLLGGCSVCATDDIKKAPPSRQLSMACLVFTWIIMAIGMGLLVIGTMANNKSRASCGFSHHHFFSIGGILCFVHAIFSVAYYTTASMLLDP